MIGIAQGSQLAFDKDLLPFSQCIVQQRRRIAYVGPYPFTISHQRRSDVVSVEGRLVVQVLEEDVFDSQRRCEPRPQTILIVQVGYLYADFHVLVGVERRDTLLRGAELPIS